MSFVETTMHFKWIKALSARDDALNDRLSKCEAELVFLKNNIALLTRENSSLSSAGNDDAATRRTPERQRIDNSESSSMGNSNNTPQTHEND